MKLEDQVVSLELAKKLKELGVEQSSYFYWEPYGDGVHLAQYNPEEIELYQGLDASNLYSAFTVAELGEMLPKGYTRADGQVAYLECDWIGSKARVDFVTDSRDRELEWASDKSFEAEAHARASMLIYLLENRLITS
jgi:hypothetical protein